ncbi:MBL fold metallo-hydrolase [Sulfurovum sp. TSL1]|uniref:MBL fold metallo-hydrolase n=1 Tax=Sulfurovum sp. TSL1 TaxID=2826994 RepID=UPI001CC43871|nr:MBL fold metallo-hydrolase [Sulfurovum sp. TSL1]GIT97538.1 arylsulfatase [Sulfurovum sp. TSL1]
MKKLFLILLLSPLLLLAQSSVTLQVLGSGGPESGDKRASSSYVIWIDGKSKILIDFGGGASLRFEEAGARIQDLDLILLTHLHVDHTADLPALLKSSFFTGASGNLQLFGPDKNKFMPNTKIFVKRLFENDKGAWQYLEDHLDGSARLQLKAHNIKKSKKESVVYKQGDIKITAVSVHHGPIPAIAYRVDIGKKSITFSGDMNGDYHTLEKLGFKTNILVMHNAVPKNAKGVAAQLHMTPLIIGEIVRKAKAGSVVISHRMLRTLGKEEETKKEIHKNYKGKVTFANDRSRYKIK